MSPSATNSSGPKQRYFAVSVGHPPTSTRKPAIDADETITKPGVGRANAAVSAEKPDGDKAYIAENEDYVRVTLGVE